MGKVQIYLGDCRAILDTLQPNSAHCVVTSPPYWGLRKYEGVNPCIWGGNPDCDHEWGEEQKVVRGHPGKKSTIAGTQTADLSKSVGGQGQFCQHCNAWSGCLGLEPTPQLFIQHLVGIFEQVRRVMRSDSVCLLNIGDSYTSGGGEGHGTRQGYKQQTNRGMNGTRDPQRPPQPLGLKPKDLCLIPERLAIALQENGWWVRARIAWCKLAPMPESVTDRPTSAWEHVWVLAKSATYFWDKEGVKEKAVADHASGNGFNRQYQLSRGGRGRKEQWNPEEGMSGRNIRNWLALPPEPTRFAHFATMPTRLADICIRAGTSAKGCCPSCGAPWARVVERYRTHNGERDDDLGAWRNTDPGSPIGAQGDGHWRYGTVSETKGWKPTCKCGLEETIPCTVLDPFAGSGTTGLVANRLGRDSVLIDASAAYIELMKQRIEADMPLLTQITIRPSP